MRHTTMRFILKRLTDLRPATKTHISASNGLMSKQETRQKKNVKAVKGATNAKDQNKNTD